MSEINQLSAADQLSSSDLTVIYSNANSDARQTSLAVLAEFLQTQISAGSMLTQYAAPSATGFTAAITPITDGASIHLLMVPVAAYASGTIVLPAKTSAAHGQEVLVTSTQAVTVLTVSGNGATVRGAPAALTTNGFFRLRYDSVEQAWTRIG